MTGEDDTGWTPLRARVDPRAFREGSLGPYRLGPVLRSTALGAVTLALHDAFEVVLEVETYDTLRGSSSVGPDGTLMSDLAEASRVLHPHLEPVLGAGLEGGVPYVVRAHHLGRPLADLIARTEAVPVAAAAVVLFAVASAAGLLAHEGTSPGVSALGGFDARDVFLGYDGAITLRGAGLRQARCPSGDPIAADRAAVVALTGELESSSGGHLVPEAELRALAAGAMTLESVARALRYRYREALAHRAALVGGTLREHFDGAIREERALFGMSPLQ